MGDVKASSRTAEVVEIREAVSEQQSRKPEFTEPVTARLRGFSVDGEPVVDFPSMPEIAASNARACVRLCDGDIGKFLMVAFEQGDVHRPIVFGVVRLPEGPEAERLSTPTQANHHPTVETDVDGDVVVINASKKMTLKCGESSITLQPDGTILIRGAYVQSRSSGVNRIQGASVRIN